MTIYIDYVLFLNFLFDFILLLSIAILLKIRIKLIRIILAAIFGSFTIFVLFLNLNSYIFFILKMLLGFLMIIIAFNFKNLKYTLNNFFYLIINSILLGGGLYFFDSNFNTNIKGLSFIYSNNKLNLFFLMFLSIILLFIYIKRETNYRKNYPLYYNVNIYVDNKVYFYKAFLDTGNKLYDPYFKRPIILISRCEFSFKNIIFVPFKTLNNKGMIECMKVDKIYIENVGFIKNVLIGKSFDKFNIDDVDMILHEDLIGGFK